MRNLLLGAALVAMGSLGSLANEANATTWTSLPGLEFSFVTDFDYPDYGYIEGGATNINFGGAEFQSGFAEFNIAGLGLLGDEHAVLDFEIGSKGTILPNPWRPAGGVFTLYGYYGTNVASRSAFTASGVGAIGSFDLAGVEVGDELSFDVTPLFDAVVQHGAPAFGVHFIGPGHYGSAQTNVYAGFRDTTLEVSAVPEPTSFALMLAGLGLVGAVASRKRLS